MYTGYRIHKNRIYQEEVETDFGLNGGHVYGGPDQPTGYFLAEGLSHNVKHIYGPDGYTKFYVQDGYIYGPNTCLPWVIGCDPDLAINEQFRRGSE